MTLTCFSTLLLALATPSMPAHAAPPRLKVSESRRFLVQEDDRPFFYVGAIIISAN